MESNSLESMSVEMNELRIKKENLIAEDKKIESEKSHLWKIADKLKIEKQEVSNYL